ncbi:hypothetical protein L6452_37536 [Arctium lappa]|uniref:Uncharacterized protein n=1 Tax=Arctium lappa TaxID=4217 RepID=A0ACB8Y2L5_ARCLA|nr:hypothetical protein L6452_37536 [Arctium lappa]
MAMPPMMNVGNGTMGMLHRKRMMMHMTFYWGTDALILFTGWPGTDIGMYVLALVFVFFLALMVEWLARCNFAMMKSNGLTSGLAQTLVHALRVGLSNMVMLALMSFNVGVFFVAVFGHALGFFLFQVLLKSSKNKPDLISTIC